MINVLPMMPIFRTSVDVCETDFAHLARLQVHMKFVFALHEYFTHSLAYCSVINRAFGAYGACD